jgi:hypothetical protein
MTKPTKATITFDNGAAPIELPMLSGSLGNDVIDIRSLGKHGVFTYDPGFMSTAACNSDITFIDGEKGLLYYRGYPIEQLAEHCNFMEVSYLLLHGELPNANKNSNSPTPSMAAPCCTISLAIFFAALGAMPTLWRLWLGWWVPCRRFTLMPWISAMLNTVKFPRIGCWLKCPP